MKISVLTPSYNTGKYLDKAIQSVLRQTYINYEHIVIDGGSADDTLSTLKKYDHLKWVSEPDKGQSDAMNKAFAASTGDIIVYLNADDEFADNAFAEVIRAFEASPNADMVVGDLIVTRPGESELRHPSVKYHDILLYWRSKFPDNPISYFYRREVQMATGNFPLDNHYTMDIWFLLKAYQKHNIVKTNTILGTFYSDGANKTANTNVGDNLHQIVKQHLKTSDPLKIPYFYFMLFQAKRRYKKQTRKLKA